MIKDCRYSSDLTPQELRKILLAPQISHNANADAYTYKVKMVKTPAHWTRRLLVSRMVWSRIQSTQVTYAYITISIAVPHSFSFMTSSPPFLFRAHIPKTPTGGCHSHRLHSHSCDRTQSTVNGQTIRISAVNGQSGVGQRSNPSAERTRFVLLLCVICDSVYLHISCLL